MKKGIMAIACISILVLVGALSGCIGDTGIKETTVYDLNTYYEEYKNRHVEVSGILNISDSGSRWILTDDDDLGYKIIFLYTSGFPNESIGEEITISGKVIGKKTVDGERIPYLIHVKIE